MKQTQIVKFTLAVAIATAVSALSLEAEVTAQKRKQLQAEMEKKREKCIATVNGVTYVSWHRVAYCFNTANNFCILSQENNPNNCESAGMFFPETARNDWYESVVKCAERLKNWILVSQRNKIKEVEKEFPNISVLTCPRRRKSSTDKYEDSPSGFGIVKFKGTVQADDQFKRFNVSISTVCDDYFDREIFKTCGTIDEIDEDLIMFLTYVNPEALWKIHKKRAAERALFQ